MVGPHLTVVSDQHAPSPEQALASLVREILDSSDGGVELGDRSDPAEALLIARESLRRERMNNDSLLEQLRDIHASRTWKLAQALRRLRHIAVPAGTLRSKVARNTLRLLRRVGVTRFARRFLPRPATNHVSTNKLSRRSDSVLRRQVEELASRCEPGRTLFIFVPSIPWDVHLFQRPQHLARQLAREGHLVVYDCSGLPQDIDGLVEREPNLFLFRGDVEHLADLPDPVLWTFTYNYSMRDLYPHKCRVVYDWIDDLSVFPYDQKMLERNHRRALREATVVVSVARKLHDVALRSRVDALYLPNAVEYDRFANPKSATLTDRVLNELLAEGKPIAGYYGALASWFDCALLESVAARRPDWNFLLIGPDYDGSLPGHSLLRKPNVRWVGPRPYEELPTYLRAMTCAMIPFKINDITLATSPLKLYEYMAGGKPVITTAMPECMAHPEVHIVESTLEFARALDRVEAEAADPVKRDRNRTTARSNSWTARTQTVMNRLQALRQVAHLENTTNRDFYRALTAFFASATGNPCFRMWFEYALTTNDRGRFVAAELSRHTPLDGKHYLDVGCAYGGFLAAFAERGAIVQGLDLDPGLLQLARTNLNEHGVDAPLMNLDATSSSFASRFQGNQDVITCNDVIEHVDDPQSLVHNLAAALRPGGFLYLEIPNEDYTPYVVEDGHFRLFGITLLEHDEAKAYYTALNPGAGYTVGHYLTLREYCDMLRRAGLEVQLLKQCVSNANLQTTLAAADTLEREASQRLSNVPEPFRERLAVETNRYLAEFKAMPRESRNDLREFKIRYAVSFWQILAHRPSN